MKKIGILTIYRSGNYGATLQAYATREAINQNGLGDADIIPYCSDAIKQKLNLAFLKKEGLFRTAVACVEKLYYHPRMKKVGRFVDEFAGKTDIAREDLPSLNDSYDIFLSGSDQIWNPQLQHGDTSYLLDFVTDDKKKRSYGSSFGVKEIPEEYRETYVKLLSSYRRITVRERAGAQLLDDLLGREAELVLDPVLLLTPEQWNEKLPKRLFKKKYVFAYQMAHSSLPAKAVSKACKTLGAGAIFVPFPILGACRCRPKLNLSSLEWVAAIRDSEAVVTDSFHGVVFSILFKKNFYYMITSQTVKKRLSRLETLLDDLGIEGRLVDSVEACDFTKTIDYDAVHARLDDLRARSVKILGELVNED